MNGSTVLVVDDNADNRDVFAALLEISGYAVLTAADGQTAVQCARALHPDLILMDISMPVMDGVEATRRLRADPATRDIPVVMVTAHGDEGHRARAREAGANGYLTKPVPPRRILQELERWLGDEQTIAVHTRHTPAGPAPATDRLETR